MRSRSEKAVSLSTVIAASATPTCAPMRPKSKISWLPPTAARLDGDGDQALVLTGVAPMRGSATSEVDRYEAVELLLVPSNVSTTPPTFGNHCARGTRKSAWAALTRARALCRDGWCSRA